MRDAAWRGKSWSIQLREYWVGCRAAPLSSRPTRSVVFFFQAEDGIRDDLVTGVQTCALPIWPCLRDPFEAEADAGAVGRLAVGGSDREGMAEVVQVIIARRDSRAFFRARQDRKSVV